MRVLLVEDDGMIGASVQKGLRQDGFSVDWVRDGKAAEAALATHTYDVVLLDLGLPGKSGTEVLKSLRRGGSDVPVLVITARDSVGDRVAASTAARTTTSSSLSTWTSSPRASAPWCAAAPAAPIPSCA